MTTITTKFYKATTFIGLLIASTLTQANPVACFNTNLGDFCIELFEAHTPITTANFLSYIENEAYINSIFHRSVPGFIIQGGGYKVVGSTSGGSTLATISTLGSINNEFKISNTRGTVAMAKLGNNPNSATSQWFVNMADNSANLNIQNGGFTVFGRVIFNGMNTFDAIEQLPISNLSNSLSEIPLIDFNGTSLTINNFVMINQVALTDTAAIYDENALSFAVDTGLDTILEVKMHIVESNPNYVLQVDLESVQLLTTKPTSVATYVPSSGELHIPSLMLNATTVAKNIVMKLTNPDTYQFTLISYEL